MVAYEFYFNNERGEPELIGIMLERRKNPLRITRDSIMKWGALAACSNVNPNCIYFIRTEVEDTIWLNLHIDPDPLGFVNSNTSIFS